MLNQAFTRLSQCGCEQGCEHCYGELLECLPKGGKEQLLIWLQDLQATEGISSSSSIQQLIKAQKKRNEGHSKGTRKADSSSKKVRSVIIAFSDIHLGSSTSDHVSFFQTIQKASKLAEVIVINGDLVDDQSPTSRKLLEAFQALALREGFWNQLVIVRSSSIHDGLLEEYPFFLYQDYLLLATAGDRSCLSTEIKSD